MSGEFDFQFDFSDSTSSQLDEGGDGSIPEALRVAQKDVYNAIRRRMAGIAHLDPDGQKSLALWKTKLEEKGYSVLYEPVSAQTSTENSYVFAIVSPWQKKVHSSGLITLWLL